MPVAFAKDGTDFIALTPCCTAIAAPAPAIIFSGVDNSGFSIGATSVPVGFNSSSASGEPVISGTPSGIGVSAGAGSILPVNSSK